MTGIELEEVHQTLLACFDANSFAQFLRMKMDRVLTNIAGPGAFRDVVFNVLAVAEQEGWDALLIARAAEVREQRPDMQSLARKYARALVGQIPATARNAQARQAYRELGLAPAGFPSEQELGSLERLIDPLNRMVNMGAWLERAVACQSPICRVEIEDEPMGTGFLVGPSAVLTNHHVVAGVLNGDELPGKVQLRFDHRQLRDGTILSGTLVGARKVLDASPATAGELAGAPEREDPDQDHLDFALLETHGTPGAEPIRVPGAPDGLRRGWIVVPELRVSSDDDPFAPDQPVLIAQHPLGKPLSLAIEWRSMLGPNPSATRVRYQTNTEAGSSGSPCFDRNWGLIALHHYGDTRYRHDPRFNQGVPIAAIRRRIEQRGLASWLGGEIA